MQRKKILLYNPKAVFYDMPLALMAIGSALDDSHYEVVIIDGRIDKNPLQLLLDHAKDALCLGITALTGAPLHDAVEKTRAIRSAFPQLPIIWGGWHTSLFPTETLRDEPAIDITVQGQGEITFRDLVAALECGADLSTINGICYRDKNGTLIKNPGRALADMNSLPRVNYDLIDVERYFKKKKQRQFDYISSTGCNFRCTFCADPFVFNRRWSAISPERMGDELSHWYKKFKFTDVNFQDETFFTKSKRVRGIANAFIEHGIKSTWAGTMRADQGSRLSDEDFDLCKKSGLRRVLVGVESGSQEMMDWLAKDIKIEQVYDTARRCAERDIHVIFPFIVGFPNESDASLLSSLRMAHELGSMHFGFTTPIFYFKPYPGSKITDDVVAQGYILPQNLKEWGDFDYVGSSGPWVVKEKYELVEHFKFYNKLATRKNNKLLLPFQKLAKLRCEKLFFSWPLLHKATDLLLPQQELS